jgi:hypothetical protein
LFDIWSIDWQLKKETIDEAEYANMPNWVFKFKVQKNVTMLHNSKHYVKKLTRYDDKET